MIPRLPFETAISDYRLLQSEWLKLSSPMQAALRIYYGLPLDEEGLKYYNVFREKATFDDLGYVKYVDSATDYVPLEHEEAWAIFGRRSGKTSGFLAFILVYEALLGGHTAFAKKSQQVVSFIVAQKLDIAQSFIRDFIEPLAASTKLMEKEIQKVNTEGILFKNGHRIAPAPPVTKNFRGFAIPVVAIDEAAFFYKDADSANPDYEVIRAVTPSQAQFPYRKLVGASTMWTKEGVIWEAKEAGMYGNKFPDDDDRKPKWKNALVLIAPTPAMQNPLLEKKWFERELKKDPDAYRREILNQAVDSVSGLFSETILREMIKDSPKAARPYKDTNFYIASLDPAFRGDDFTFTIGHYESEGGFYQDLLKKWSPKETKLNPSVILDEVKVDLDKYNVQVVYSDQYQLESLQQLALDRGFSIVGQDFTANSKSKLFGSFLQLGRNNRIHLLRDFEQFQQFLWIQRTIGNGGYIRISAPVGKHDDMVTVTVMCAAMAIRFEGGKGEQKEKPQSWQDEIMTKIMEKKRPDPDKEWL